MSPLKNYSKEKSSLDKHLFSVESYLLKESGANESRTPFVQLRTRLRYAALFRMLHIPPRIIEKIRRVNLNKENFVIHRDFVSSG
jgi:hypothetical protein